MFDFFKSIFEPQETFSGRVPLCEKTCEQAAQEFKSDYLEDDKFLNNFRDPIKARVRQRISEGLDAAIQPDEFSDRKYKIYHLFSALRDIYFYLWLEQTNYGDRLAEKESQLLYVDDYGDICDDDWERELKSFLEKRLYLIEAELDQNIPEKFRAFAEKLDSSYCLSFGDCEKSARETMEDALFTLSLIVNAYSDMLVEGYCETELDNVVDPYQYEQAISNELVKFGWNSRTTTGSGDQGADVIAEKNGEKLIVQCKLYSSPVGNKAVQEVAAAKGFYFGSYSAVISNQGFTKSAKQLAESLDVFLLHHSQIQKLDELLFEE